jgi:hypothetical protein
MVAGFDVRGQQLAAELERLLHVFEGLDLEPSRE